MRKFLKSFLITLILIGATFSPIIRIDKTFAQIQPGAVPNFNPIKDGSTPANPVTNNSSRVGSSAGKDITPPDGPEIAGCIGFNGLYPYINFTACLANLVYLIMWIVSWVLYLAGRILDMSIFYTINMADLLSHVPVVDIGWRIFRDLANVCFIFILLWIALSTIIGLNSGKTKELLVHLILVALLINFSLFITKAVIDGSNIVTLHFYNLIVSPVASPANSTTSQKVLATLTPNSSFSGAFMEGLKIQTLYDSQKEESGSLAGKGLASAGGGVLNFGKIILVGIGGTILMLVASYVFLAAAVLFIIRAVVLMMVMILSPLAFLGFVLPSTEGYSDKWKEALINQSIFAPIYMILCYVVVKTIQSPAFKAGVTSIPTSNDSLASAFTAGSTGGMAIIFNYILLIALMISSLLVAKKMEAYGADTVSEWGKELRKKTQGIVGRSVVNGSWTKPVTWMAGNVGLGKAGTYLQGKTFFGAQKVGKALSNLHAKVETPHGRDAIRKKFDVNELDRKFGAKFGSGEFANFVRENTTGGSLFGTKAKFGDEKSVHEAHEESEKLENKADDIKSMNEARTNASDIENSEKLIEKNEKDKANPVTSPTRLAEIDKKIADEKIKISQNQDKLQKNLGKVSTSGFVEMGKEFFKNEQVMKNVSAEKYMALMKDENTLTKEEKKLASEARWGKDAAEFTRYSEAAKQERELEIKKSSYEETRKNYNATNPGQDYATKTAGLAELAEISTLKGEVDKLNPKLDPALKKKMKNMKNLGEFEMMNRHFPEMFANTDFVERIPQSMVEGIRGSEAFTSNEKDRVRDNKSTGVADAVWADLGLDIDKMRELSTEKQLEMKEAAESRRAANPSNFINTLDARGKALHLYAQGQIGKALGGKGGGELAKMPSELWNSDIVMRNMSAGQMSEFKMEDEDDKRKIFNHMVREFKSSNGNPSAQLIEKMKWILNKSTGQTFCNFTASMDGEKDSADLIKNWQSMIVQYATSSKGEENTFVSTLPQATRDAMATKAQATQDAIEAQAEARKNARAAQAQATQTAQTALHAMAPVIQPPTGGTAHTVRARTAPPPRAPLPVTPTPPQAAGTPLSIRRAPPPGGSPTP